MFCVCMHSTLLNERWIKAAAKATTPNGWWCGNLSSDSQWIVDIKWYFVHFLYYYTISNSYRFLCSTDAYVCLSNLQNTCNAYSYNFLWRLILLSRMRWTSTQNDINLSVAVFEFLFFTLFTSILRFLWALIIQKKKKKTLHRRQYHRWKRRWWRADAVHHEWRFVY